MNRVVMIGRITKDIEVRMTQSGKSVTIFSLAVDRRKKDSGADFFRCVAWDTTAELMGKYLRKGSRVAISGRLATRTYDKGGEQKHVTEIVVDEVEFLDSKPKTAQEPEQQGAAQGGDKFEEMQDDSDLPF